MLPWGSWTFHPGQRPLQPTPYPPSTHWYSWSSSSEDASCLLTLVYQRQSLSVPSGCEVGAGCLRRQKLLKLERQFVLPAWCQPETENVQTMLGISGWLLTHLPGMSVRFWSHEQCFVFPWEPAEEELVNAETLASTGWACPQALERWQ